VSGAFVTALTAPLLELQAAVGSGVFSGDDPSRMLCDAGQIIADVVSVGASAAAGMGAQWSGAAANAAGQAISTALATASDLSTHASAMAGRVGNAAEAIARARAELQRIVDEFTATAHALEPGLPRTAGALADAAQRAMDEATGVVAELEAELDGHASAVAQPVAPQAVTSPAGLMTSALPAMTGWASTVPSAMSGLLGTFTGIDPDAAQLTHAADAGTVALGTGVAVRLPDGSTVTAPNPVAADAVRHALTQLGVPYRWGGSTPGVALDCSGLTQWAYHASGLDLPRLAELQDVGAAVSPSALLPGDLAVWDGHVAMVVGDGMMIEAGDPVQLSPIRTTNAGQGFQGFWRPTA
jgi:cell wall-associated NlpC family hydrolase